MTMLKIVRKWNEQSVRDHADEIAKAIWAPVMGSRVRAWIYLDDRGVVCAAYHSQLIMPASTDTTDYLIVPVVRDMPGWSIDELIADDVREALAAQIATDPAKWMNNCIRPVDLLQLVCGESCEAVTVGDKKMKASEFLETCEYPVLFLAGVGCPGGQSIALTDDAELPFELHNLVGTVNEGVFGDVFGVDNPNLSDWNCNTIYKIEIQSDEDTWKREEES